jgi:hypothetical protein
MNAYAPMIHTHINLFHAASQVTTCLLYSNNHACCSLPCMFTLCCTWQHIINWLSHPFCCLKCRHPRIWLEFMCACLCDICIRKQGLYVVKSWSLLTICTISQLCSCYVRFGFLYYCPLYQRLIMFLLYSIAFGHLLYHLLPASALRELTGRGTVWCSM